ncbi:hypothetical protein COB57_06250 [Candidatus Peregrinibacteria bacterium]|nr:MAG: hypothetical protein COB57_06250 [Candidatus Peregrinibacteria bacterium]
MINFLNISYVKTLRNIIAIICSLVLIIPFIHGSIFEPVNTSFIRSVEHDMMSIFSVLLLFLIGYFMCARDLSTRAGKIVNFIYHQDIKLFALYGTIYTLSVNLLILSLYFLFQYLQTGSVSSYSSPHIRDFIFPIMICILAPMMFHAYSTKEKTTMFHTYISHYFYYFFLSLLIYGQYNTSNHFLAKIDLWQMMIVIGLYILFFHFLYNKLFQYILKK